MADEASKTPIPQPTKEDHEDVSWALSTAEATWNRGDRSDALKWLRRAAESASEAEHDDRALQLAKAAAELASQLDPSTGTSSAPSTRGSGAGNAPPPIARPSMTGRPPVPMPGRPSARPSARPSGPPVRPPPVPAVTARAKPSVLPAAGKGPNAPPSPFASTLPSQGVPIRSSLKIPTPTTVSVPSGIPQPAASSSKDLSPAVKASGAGSPAAPRAPFQSSATRAAMTASKPTVRMEAVRTTARYSEAPDVPKQQRPNPSDSSKDALALRRPSVSPVPPATSPDVERASRLAQMARSSGDDTATTWTGAEDRPSEPETPESKRGANGNAERGAEPKTPPAAGVEDKATSGKHGPTTTRFASNATADEIDEWPTAALNGDELPEHAFMEEQRTRLDAPAYRDADENAYDGSAIVPPKTGDVRPTQAVRVVVWRAADGVHVAPHGTTVSAISVDAMLVALDPTADLFAWLKGK
jgi:hypothetical protein